MSLPLTSQDRRHRRRAETIEQIIDIAIDVMGEVGVAGLSLGEVARRMGMRTPSLYGYFASKNDVYDAVFARGWQELSATMETVAEPDGAVNLSAYLLDLAETFVRWTVAHPVYAELMNWRPVPGYNPSAQAYAYAVEALERGRAVLAELQRLGLFRPDVAVDELLRTWTVLLSGVMTQQLANAPEEPYESGTFTTMLPQLVAMYLAHYQPTPRRGRRADNR
ncbi:MAG: TetR/AcrR family transcriptional regulator [Actinobacteria bacterium]|nr:TetR/AcrR family transcriptional regulator [Actinomycetota bacterium]MBW3646476.1 TetR/AcrR family transcriptional regulator [Actinomycetota bacterium]